MFHEWDVHSMFSLLDTGWRMIKGLIPLLTPPLTICVSYSLGLDFLFLKMEFECLTDYAIIDTAAANTEEKEAVEA